jgi:hypothetical protein
MLLNEVAIVRRLKLCPVLGPLLLFLSMQPALGWQILEQPFDGYGVLESYQQQIACRLSSAWTPSVTSSDSPLVRVKFSRKGKLSEVKLVRSSGSVAADAACLAALASQQLPALPDKSLLKSVTAFELTIDTRTGKVIDRLTYGGIWSGCAGRYLPAFYDLPTGFFRISLRRQLGLNCDLFTGWKGREVANNLTQYLGWEPTHIRVPFYVSALPHYSIEPPSRLGMRIRDESARFGLANSSILQWSPKMLDIIWLTE